MTDSGSSAAWRRIATGVYLVAVVVAVGWAFRSDWSEVSEQLADVSIVALAGALLLAAGGLACSVFAWLTIIRALGERIDTAAGAGIFLVSQVGKYLPGSVWPALAQLQMGSQRGLAKRANLASFFLALLLAIVSGLVVGVMAWASLVPERLLFVVPGLALAVVLGRAGLARWPVVRARLPATIATRLPAQRPPERALIMATGVLCIGWVLNGLQFYLVADTLGLDADLLLVRSVAGYAIAFVGGLLFIIAPAGAGVREGILVVLLGNAASVGVVTAAALLSRLVVTVVDLLGAAIGAALGRRAMASSTTG